MEDWLQERIKLGRTDLKAGRLGLGSSYMAPARAFEAAFEAGCNYFYWGALRTPMMTHALKTILSRGKRDELIIVIQAYIRSRGLGWSLKRGLRSLGIGHADILLLGWHDSPPAPRLLDDAERLREQGLFRYLGLSGHKRSLLAAQSTDPQFDLLMLRYNAAHRGAETDIFPHLSGNRPGVVGFTATRWGSLMKSKQIPAGEKRPSAGDCYRFVLADPHVDVVITAPSNIRQMQENLREVNKGPMSDEELVWMRRIGDAVYGRPTANPRSISSD